MVDVTLNIEVPGERGAIKLQDATWEVNIWAPLVDLARLRDVRGARWEARGSLQIGQCAGAAVWWSEQDGQVAVLVGHDDETWDVAVWVPLSTIDEIAALAARELSIS